MDLKELLSIAEMVAGGVLVAYMICAAIHIVWIVIVIKDKPICSVCNNTLTRELEGKHRTPLEHLISVCFFDDRLRKYKCHGKTQYTKIPPTTCLP